MTDLIALARESGANVGATVIVFNLRDFDAFAARIAKAPEDERAEMEARKDAAYLERNQVVAALASAYPSGIKRTAIDGWSDDWNGCVYIDLPTGQASWHYHDSHAHLFAHLPPYAGEWDGHTTEQKYERLASLPPAHQEAPGWLPIETAPMLGVRIPPSHVYVMSLMLDAPRYSFEPHGPIEERALAACIRRGWIRTEAASLLYVLTEEGRAAAKVCRAAITNATPSPKE